MTIRVFTSRRETENDCGAFSVMTVEDGQTIHFQHGMELLSFAPVAETPALNEHVAHAIARIEQIYALLTSLAKDNTSGAPF